MVDVVSFFCPVLGRWNKSWKVDQATSYRSDDDDDEEEDSDDFDDDDDDDGEADWTHGRKGSMATDLASSKKNDIS